MGSDAVTAVTAEVVLACTDLGPTLQYFTDRLGFRVEVVFPADAPRVAVVSGHGTRVRLDPDAGTDPGRLRLVGTPPGPSEETAPNGTVISWESDAMIVPDLVPSFTLTRADDAWGQGRAGMQYRDLVPDRQGGRFIASHIRIPDGGPVPDWVHFHEIRFQLIVCRRGWVEVVYEDQGPPFVLEAGDCVLQPPEIRHRVLRASDGLEVIEIACPAEHRTVADHERSLPTPTVDPGRVFGGQRFVRHVGASATWAPWRFAGFEAQDTAVGEATQGLAGVRFVRPTSGGVAPHAATHGAEFVFAFVLEGSIDLRTGDTNHTLAAGDSVVVPADLPYQWSRPSTDLRLLDVTLPAAIPA